MSLTIKNYFISHLRNCVNRFGELCRAPLHSLTIISVISVALALPTGLLILLTNVKQWSANWDHGIQMTIFLQQDITTPPSELTDFFAQKTIINKVRYLSKQEALHEFETITGVQDILSDLTNNPLPALFICQLQPSITPEDAKQLQQDINQLAAVDSVLLDLAWLQRISTLINVAENSLIILTTILAFAVLLIIVNTTHLTLENRREQIYIAKLIGATHDFIRREFLYLGFWYGFLGAMLAWVLMSITLRALNTPIAELAKAFDSSLTLTGLNAETSSLLIILGSVLGIGGAWVSVNRHLNTLNII